ISSGFSAGRKKAFAIMAMAATAAPPRARMSFQPDDTVFNETAPWFCVGFVQMLAGLKAGHNIRRSWRCNPRGQFYRSEMVTDYCVGGGGTGLRNTPIPATLTSTTSPATSGPTPAGVPVAITSPGYRVIMREIQRTRNAQG